MKLSEKQIDEAVAPMIADFLNKIDELNSDQLETNSYTNYHSGYNDGAYAVGKESRP